MGLPCFKVSLHPSINKGQRYGTNQIKFHNCQALQSNPHKSYKQINSTYLAFFLVSRGLWNCTSPAVFQACLATPLTVTSSRHISTHLQGQQTRLFLLLLFVACPFQQWVFQHSPEVGMSLWTGEPYQGYSSDQVSFLPEQLLLSPGFWHWSIYSFIFLQAPIIPSKNNYWPDNGVWTPSSKD